MDEACVDRIFAGSLIDLPPVSSKIVRIFTSSTFTDMLMERNTLMEYVYPKINRGASCTMSYIQDTHAQHVMCSVVHSPTEN